MKKRFISILLVSIMATALTACAGSSQTTTSESESSTDKETAKSADVTTASANSISEDEDSTDGTASFKIDSSEDSGDSDTTEEKPLELVDYGWYISDSADDTAYMNFVGIVNNPNENLAGLFPDVTVTVRNGDGTIAATQDQMGMIIMPEDTITLVGMLSMPTDQLTDDAQISFDVDCDEFSAGTSGYSACKTTDFEITNVSENAGDETYITGEIKNNFTEDVDCVNVSLVLRKDGEIVYAENTFIDGLKKDATKAFQFQFWNTLPEHDTIDVSAQAW